MATTLTVRDGVLILPADLRDRYELVDGSEVVAEESAAGILLRMVKRSDPGEIEIYSPERKAEFLLNNAVDAADYTWARDEARRMGVNPDLIPHEPPKD